ncbi:hypothetical protein [Streptomyces albus]|nr:hypothetical protein [Streptomyces albus]
MAAEPIRDQALFLLLDPGWIAIRIPGFPQVVAVWLMFRFNV